MAAGEAYRFPRRYRRRGREQRRCASSRGRPRSKPTVGSVSTLRGGSRRSCSWLADVGVTRPAEALVVCQIADQRPFTWLCCFVWCKSPGM